MSAPQLKAINIKKRSRVLSLSYVDGNEYELSFELLRVMSPSAEVKGHGPGQEVLQTGKANVQIEGLETVGNYAVQIIFNDGHDSGIYSWTYLYDLATRQEQYWQDYLDKLEKAGESRYPPQASVVQEFIPPK